MSVQVSDRVLHRVFGLGSVIELKVGGAYARVRFPAVDATLWVASEECRVLSLDDLAAKRAGLGPVRDSRDPVRLKGDATPRYAPQRRLIEALRLGIVPEAFVPEFTFGRERTRDHVLGRVGSGIAAGRGRAFIVEDEYGRGKTHFLLYLRAQALRQGYAVSTVAFDPEEVTPFRVKRVYAEIVRSLAWVREGSLRGFRDLLTARQAHLASAHPYLTPFLALRDAGRLREHHWRWIEGDHRLTRRLVHLPALLEDHVASNLYVNLITALASLLQRIGVPGWLLVFDESEALGAIQSAAARRKGANLLRGLILAASGRTAEGPDLALTSTRAYGQEVARNPRSGLLYSRRRRDVLPYRFRPQGADPEPLIFPLFAFTPVRAGYHDEIEEWVAPDDRLGLPDLGRSEYRRLLKALVAAYGKAYAVTLDQADEPLLFEALMERFGLHLRSWIKGGVEALDLVRFHPGRSLPDLLGDDGDLPTP